MLCNQRILPYIDFWKYRPLMSVGIDPDNHRCDSHRAAQQGHNGTIRLAAQSKLPTRM
jgi:hypothetical protein